MSAETSSCTVSHLDHVGIAVTSVEAALAVFRWLLDAPETEIIEEPELGVRAALVAQGQTRIELLEPTHPDSPIGRHIARRGEGLHHIAFQVDDISAKLAQLKSAGVPLLDEEPRRGLTGTIAFMHPDAVHHVLVELVEPAESRVREQKQA
jgi:methylmalonyl-CoA epimerase